MIIFLPRPELNDFPDLQPKEPSDWLVLILFLIACIAVIVTGVFFQEYFLPVVVIGIILEITLITILTFKK